MPSRSAARVESDHARARPRAARAPPTSAAPENRARRRSRRARSAPRAASQAPAVAIAQDDDGREIGHERRGTRGAARRPASRSRAPESVRWIALTAGSVCTRSPSDPRRTTRSRFTSACPAAGGIASAGLRSRRASRASSDLSDRRRWRCGRRTRERPRVPGTVSDGVVRALAVDVGLEQPQQPIDRRSGNTTT